MASSGTTSFNLNIDEIIDEAYERCGLSTDSGYDLKRARRNLNLLLSEWGNRGLHLWKVKNYEQVLTSGTEQYATPSDCSDVLEAYISTGAGTGPSITDVSLTKTDRSNYAALPNKGATGQPSQYYVDRQLTPQIYLYQTPDASTYTYLKYYYIVVMNIFSQIVKIYYLIPYIFLYFFYYLNKKMRLLNNLLF